MPRITMAHEILEQPEVVALVAERVTCAMPQHVRPDAAEPRALAGFPDEVIDGCASSAGHAQRRTTRVDDQPRVLMSDPADFETWLSGSTEDAFKLARSYAAEQMRIVQSGSERGDLLRVA
jgi:hypothetical protein